MTCVGSQRHKKKFLMLWIFLEICPVQLSSLFWLLRLFHSVWIYVSRFLDTFVVGCLLYATAFGVIFVRVATATVGYCSKNASLRVVVVVEDVTLCSPSYTNAEVLYVVRSSASSRGSFNGVSCAELAL